MRNQSRPADFLRSHWLEAILLAGLLGVLIWFVNVGVSFLPRPTPTPVPAPTAAGRLPLREPGGGGVTATPPTANTAIPSRSPSSTPVPTATAAVPVQVTLPISATRSVGLVFDGKAALQQVLAQTAIGPRPAGSPANRQTQAYISSKLIDYGWQVEGQDFAYMNVACRNLIGKANAGKGPVVILGAHYDTRRQADNDPTPAARSQPVMGADDGASGVAVLLELARTLDKSRVANEVRLAFFDAEDDGRLDGWDFIAGSRYMADHMGQTTPQYVIVIDMIGDADQQIYREHSSTPALQDRIWQVAGDLGYTEFFRPDYKYTMLDDHTPFLEHGWPAQDLIDFDYPYWHTTQDTADKISAASLEHVGRVLQRLLQSP